MAYLHIDCVHIAHYFVHIAGLHIAYLDIACVHNSYLEIASVHNAYLDIASVRSKTRCYTGRHEHIGHRPVTMQCAVFVSVQNTVCTHFGASGLVQASFAEAPTSGATVYIG